MDYEFDGFGAIDADYDAARPPFEETLSPPLPRGLNLGRQIFYLERNFPAEFAGARAFLAYPQYLVVAPERRHGVRGDLARRPHRSLAPERGRLSSLVDRLGWRRLFPPMRRAWDTLGPLRPEIAAATGLAPDVRVVCGAHDSNASLVPHLVSRARSVHRGLDRHLGHHHGGRRQRPARSRRPTCWPMSTCAAAGADRALHGRARIRGPRGRTPADADEADVAAGGRLGRDRAARPFPTRAARSPGARAGSRARRPRRPRRARRSRRSMPR